MNPDLKTTKWGLDCVRKPHADRWPLQVDKLGKQGPCCTRRKLLPLLLQQNLITGKPWGQAGHWEHGDEQTIRYYLKESSVFQRKMVPLSVTLTIGLSTWHWISHLRRMNTTTHSWILTKIMRGLFSPLFKTYKGKLMQLCETRPCRNRSMQLTQMNMPLQWLGVEWTVPKTFFLPLLFFMRM